MQGLLDVDLTLAQALEFVALLGSVGNQFGPANLPVDEVLNLTVEPSRMPGHVKVTALLTNGWRLCVDSGHADTLGAAVSPPRPPRSLTCATSTGSWRRSPLTRHS